MESITKLIKNFVYFVKEGGFEIITPNTNQDNAEPLIRSFVQIDGDVIQYVNNSVLTNDVLVLAHHTAVLKKVKQLALCIQSFDWLRRIAIVGLLVNFKNTLTSFTALTNLNLQQIISNLTPIEICWMIGLVISYVIMPIVKKVY